MTLSGAGAISSAQAGQARIGNVSAVLTGRAAASAENRAAARALLDGSFVDVRETEADLTAWLAALEAGTGDRVLFAVVGERAPSRVAVLALVCWPEADALVFRDGEDDAEAGALVLLRRESMLPSARDAVSRGEADPFVWLDSIEAERVGPVELGLALPSAEAC